MAKTLRIFMFALLALFAAQNANANDRKVITITTAATSADSGEGHDHYIYNAQGQLMWVQSTTNSSRDVYEYNAEGQKVKKTTYSWIPADNAYKMLNVETYTYEGEKLVRMDQKLNAGSAFERNYYNIYVVYEDGNSGWSQYNANGDVLRYQYKEVYEKDAAGLVTKKTVLEFDPDYPEDGWYPYESSDYTLAANGDIATETYKTYKSDGSVKKTNERTYTFADLDAAYVPTNVKSTPERSSITLSWDPVAGATKYIVTYDLEHKTAEGTSYTVSGINVGEHEFVVQAVIDDVERNGSEIITASVVDPGKLPAENLTADACTLSKEVNDEGDNVTFYTIPLTWTVPANHSEIKSVRIYLTDTETGAESYVSPEDITVTSYTLKLYEWQVRHTDDKGEYTTPANFDISVVIIYASGAAEPSNIVTLCPYNAANGIEDGIENVTPATSTSATYNLAGQHINSNEKGIVIKSGKKVMNR